MSKGNNVLHLSIVGVAWIAITFEANLRQCMEICLPEDMLIFLHIDIAGEALNLRV